MDKVSYVGNADVNAIDDLYKNYQKDPQSIDSGLAKIFSKDLISQEPTLKKVEKSQITFTKNLKY